MQGMKNKAIQLSTLKPNDRNPRTIKGDAFQRLCDSIKRDPQFMALRPIVVDETNVILGGNQRYRACQHLGMTKVPAAWVKVASGLTPEQRKRFIVVDNAPEGMAGEWDFDILAADWGLPDLDTLGFEKLLAELPVDEHPVADRAGASPWDRVGDAAEGVMFSFGDVQCRLPIECYERFKRACPESEIPSWVNGVICACTNH